MQFQTGIHIVDNSRVGLDLEKEQIEIIKMKIDLLPNQKK